MARKITCPFCGRDVPIGSDETRHSERIRKKTLRQKAADTGVTCSDGDIREEMERIMQVVELKLGALRKR
jgi:hypothetical protein